MMTVRSKEKVKQQKVIDSHTGCPKLAVARDQTTKVHLVHRLAKQREDYLAFTLN